MDRAAAKLQPAAHAALTLTFGLAIWAGLAAMAFGLASWSSEVFHGTKYARLVDRLTG